MFLGARAAVDVVACIGLRDEHGSLGINRQAIEQRAEGVDGGDEAISLCIVNVEVAIWHAGVFHNVGLVAKGEYIVICDGMLVCVEGDKFAVDAVAAGKLGLVV